MFQISAHDKYTYLHESTQYSFIKKMNIEKYKYIVYEPEGVLTTTWGGKCPLYFSESYISRDTIFVW